MNRQEFLGVGNAVGVVRRFVGLLVHPPAPPRFIVGAGPAAALLAAFLLAIHAIDRKGQDLEPLHRDIVFALLANSITAAIEADKRVFDGSEPLLGAFDEAGVGLHVGERPGDV